MEMAETSNVRTPANERAERECRLSNGDAELKTIASQVIGVLAARR
jgi:hypothetical protein